MTTSLTPSEEGNNLLIRFEEKTITIVYQFLPRNSINDEINMYAVEMLVFDSGKRINLIDKISKINSITHLK